MLLAILLLALLVFFAWSDSLGRSVRTTPEQRQQIEAEVMAAAYEKERKQAAEWSAPGTPYPDPEHFTACPHGYLTHCEACD